MSEEEKTLNVIDETIQAAESSFKEFIEVLETSRTALLKLENDKPVLAITPEDAKKGKCTECLACEIFCTYHEQDSIFIYLPIPGLKEYRDKVIKERKK